MDTNLFKLEQKGANRIIAKCVLMALTTHNSRLLAGEEHHVQCGSHPPLGPREEMRLRRNKGA